MPPVTKRSWAIALLATFAGACGGGASMYRVTAAPPADGVYARTAATGTVEPALEEQAMSVQAMDSDEGGSGGEAGDMEMAAPARAAPQPSAPPPPPSAPGGAEGFRQLEQFAQNDNRRREATTPPQVANPRAPDDHSATDATSGPLLIYQAILHLAVYQVQDNQRAVVAIAREMDGFLAQQSDTIIVIRVPARKFQEALGRIEALGDVLHRNIQATDVSEEFRDTTIRLRNLEQVRDRLAALLAQARTVEESLQIERELERLTTEIESMKGRLRFLEDRIAFSTITVNFSPREQETLQGELFNLPFDFLYNMGLRTLLNLR